jgi:general stress protein CsbA
MGKVTEQNNHMETLTEIRDIMERSSRFLSLSGLSGVFAGIFALIGAGIAYIYLDLELLSNDYYIQGYELGYKSYLVPGANLNTDFLSFFFIDALSVLFLSLLVGSILTTRKARKKGLKIMTRATKMMMLHLSIPLIAGGLFCLILVYHKVLYLIAPATLIFYGLALLNAGKYTYNDIRYLGVFEIFLGLLASIFAGYGLLFWAFGFGVMHIIYGIVMYYKYDRK